MQPTSHLQILITPTIYRPYGNQIVYGENALYQVWDVMRLAKIRKISLRLGGGRSNRTGYEWRFDVPPTKQNCGKAWEQLEWAPKTLWDEDLDDEEQVKMACEELPAWKSEKASDVGMDEVDGWKDLSPLDSRVDDPDSWEATPDKDQLGAE